MVPRLIATKFDGSKYRSYPGGPRVTSELEALILKMARENSGWGYDRIIGAQANLGHRVSDQTVGNDLRRHRIDPAPKRSQNRTWKIRSRIWRYCLRREVGSLGKAGVPLEADLVRRRLVATCAASRRTKSPRQGQHFAVPNSGRRESAAGRNSVPGTPGWAAGEFADQPTTNLTISNLKFGPAIMFGA